MKDEDKTKAQLIQELALLCEQVVALSATKETLAKREAQLALIFENAYDGISIHQEFPGQPERRLIECNERYAEMAGRSKQELLAIGNTMRVQRDVEPGVDSRVFFASAHAGRAYCGTFSWIRPDGKENVIEYTAGQVIVNGQVIIIGCDRDITERLQEQKALQMYSEQLEAMVAERTSALHAQYRQLDAILSSGTDGIVVTDATGHIIQANPIAQAWLTQTLYPQDAAKLTTALQDLTRQAITLTGSAGTPSTVLELPGIDLELHAALVKSEDAVQSSMAVVNIHDISHLKTLERMRTTFITNVSHELRTPITTIKLCAHLIKQYPDQLKKYLPLLTEAVEQQTQLIQDIVILARLDAGRIDLQRRAVLLNELIQASIDNCQMHAQERGVTIIPLPLEVEMTLSADPNYINQMLTRLLENAIAYTPTGGTVTITAQRHDIDERAGITLSVTDTGPHIPAAELPHIFERFFRGENPQPEQTKGTGLGLPIAKAIAELHGGRITVESTPVSGTTFTVWLPLFSL